MKTIPLTKGYEAIVDDEDYEWLNQIKWHVRSDHYHYYASTNIKKGKKFHSKAMHQIILGEKKGFITDHIDGNTLNNCRNNLRFATFSENCCNRVKRAKTSSEFKGVSFKKKNKKWQSNICINKKTQFLGFFDSEVEAAYAYDEAARKYHGEFSRTNF